MKTSAFEVLGPIMVGPSSSHTAGALRIARVARSIAPLPIKLVTFSLYNSFARTYRGHGTDRALVAGILGLDTDDVRIRDSFDLSEQAGLAYSFVEMPDGTGHHPNTVDIAMTLADGTRLSVMGESLGGGRIRISQIDSVPVEVTGELNTLFVSHVDAPGVLAALTGVLTAADINIATMHTYRKERGGEGYSVFEVDEELDPDLVRRVGELPRVDFASLIRVPGAPPAASTLRLTMRFCEVPTFGASPDGLDTLFAGEVFDLDSDHLRARDAARDLLVDLFGIVRGVLLGQQPKGGKLLSVLEKARATKGDGTAEVRGEPLGEHDIGVDDAKGALGLSEERIELVAGLRAMEVDRTVGIDVAHWHGVGVSVISRARKDTRGVSRQNHLGLLARQLLPCSSHLPKHKRLPSPIQVCRHKAYGPSMRQALHQRLGHGKDTCPMLSRISSTSSMNFRTAGLASLSDGTAMPSEMY